MSKTKKLYIDSEGVRWGYYVYLHKDLATGEVFYVGKGHGRRAKNTEGRHPLWYEKVESLVNGWEIEIIKEDLSEIEAEKLEGELIQTYGGAASQGGKLVNWIPGIDYFSVGFSLGDKTEFEIAMKRYRDARTFKEFPRQQQECMAMSLINESEPIIEALLAITYDVPRSYCILNESASSVESDLSLALGACNEFLRHRISWKDLCFELEDAKLSFEILFDEIDDHDDRVKPLLLKSYDLINILYSKIDSGNREEALILARAEPK